jgi:mono/diheme cytochrome c family protein
MARSPLIAATVLFSLSASAHRLPMGAMPRRNPPRTTLFQPMDALPAIGGATGVARTGGSIAAVWNGSVVLDGDSGELVAVNLTGQPTARVKIGRDVGQLLVAPDERTVYAADRGGDRVVVVSLPELAVARSFPVRGEPWGLALAPDGKTLLVTAIADRSVSAYTAATGEERWTVPLGADPRGVAVSPDGRRAVVTYLSQGVVARLDLTTERPTLGFVTLGGQDGPSLRATAAAAVAEGDRGRSFARAAFAVAFLSDRIAVVPHQLATPNQVAGDSPGTYGGSASNPPIAHRLDFIDVGGAPAEDRVSMAHLGLSQPRSLAWDPVHDTLVVAGYGEDVVIGIADVRKGAPRLAWRAAVPRCAPTGVGVTAAGDAVRVYCESSRSVVSLRGDASSPSTRTVQAGPAVTESQVTATVARGRDLFRKASAAVSANGAMACASCHPDARTDGLSWRIESRRMQTPLLAGRLAGTQPYKWDGKDPTLEKSLQRTVVRLGGKGISKQEVADLAAYLTSLPAPRAPAAHDAVAAARGKAVFAGAGCTGCHAGPKMTLATQHKFESNLPEVDTPSLLGLAWSAPYYHDGSAPTLRAVLLDNGKVHGMLETHLEGRQIDDLVAYLETL